MADKKPEESEQSADAALQKQVDDMMSISRGDGTPAVSIDTEPKDVKAASAPALPEQPKGDVYELKAPEKPPIVIKLADEKEAGPEAPTETAEATAEPTPLDDSVTDKAVDDIAAKESDIVLAVEDARAAKKSQAAAAAPGPGWKARLRSLLKNKWTWAGVVAILLVVLALPFTRYRLLGLFLKKPVTITVLDSKTAAPVSSAEVQLGGAEAKTDGEGHAHLKAALGSHSLKISKQYYQPLSSTYFVGFKAAPAISYHLVATGRLVPITVVNFVSGKPVGGAQILVKGTNAKTNKAGQAIVALPTTAASYSATISLTGYNPANVNVQVTDQVVKANTFMLTPAGHIYFLSNLSGRIDVVKTNLDGSARKTVLSGTGQEAPNTTSLLASRDWRYLVLEARRDTSLAALYLIDTATDKVTSIDSSDSTFNLVGWFGHDFIYDLTKNGATNWQTGREALKSYDADHQQLNLLDQNQAEGSSASYAYQYFSNFYVLNGIVAYTTQWNSFASAGTAYDMTGKNDSIRAVQPAGQNKKDYQTFPADSTNFIQAALYEPQAIYYAVYNSSGQASYYDFENLSLKTVSLDSSTLNQGYPTFLVSPSGNQTFWTELRDGKNTLFVGDNNAGSKQQVASLSDYSPYGWFGNNYLLVSKNSSELYIMPISGGTPVKITDYYKPAQNFSGYGYGYGGL